MRKLVILGATAVAAGTVGLLSAGTAGADPVNPNQMNVIGEPYYKAVKILHGMGLQTGFGGAVGSALPQAQCMVSSQKMGGQSRMLLNLDCTEEAAQEMAESGALGTGSAPGAVGGNTLRPEQVPIAPGAAAPAPAPPLG
ncbi:MAG TPA: hypothetical protein VJR50_18525 [Mycobacterium sp.]|nr:hypothetical protein [Mycobacterium sp.]